MSKPGEFCTPCFARHKTKPAVNWCASCEESLCSKCGSHHKVQTSTKSHQLNSLSDILMLPSVAMTISLTCKQHDMKLDVFCSDHSEPCCWKCLSEDHSKCQQKDPLDKVVKNAKTSESVNTLVENIQNIIEITDNLRKKKKENYKLIESQKNEMETQIKGFKKDVIKYIELFEKNLSENVMKTFNVCQIEMQETYDELNAFYKQCSDIDKSLTNMKQFASDLQTFLGARSLRSRVATIENGILGLRKQLGDYKLKFISPLNIDNFKSKMASLGDIKIVRDEYKESFKFQKITHAQALLQQSPKEKPEVIENNKAEIDPVSNSRVSEDLYNRFQNISLTPELMIQQKFVLSHTKDYININRCAILSNSDFLFTDYENNSLIRYRNDGVKTKTIKLFSNPWGVCEVQNNTVAINFPVQSTIQILDISSTRSKVKKSIQTENICSAISYDSPNLVTVIRNTGIQIYDISGKLLNTVKIDFNDIKDIAIHSSKLYYTDWKRNEVVSCEMDGKICWRFEQQDLKCPNGLTVDNDGSVFVVGTSSGNILKISSDGSSAKEILRTEDFFQSPTGIYLQKEKRLLLICFHDNPFAATYQVIM
ncbi:unnamed protein product [Mytilus coruscus]|uniref:B box-type domain-containing protein n=1 Tax=Mytilus coruscus TaxID=42192 RepID=A0A6J8C8D3_MYTCO|nr:unnamed protein product [Mytilus coruscus]